MAKVQHHTWMYTPTHTHILTPLFATTTWCHAATHLWLCSAYHGHKSLCQGSYFPFQKTDSNLRWSWDNAKVAAAFNKRLERLGKMGKFQYSSLGRIFCALLDVSCSCSSTQSPSFPSSTLALKKNLKCSIECKTKPTLKPFCRWCVQMCPSKIKLQSGVERRAEIVYLYPAAITSNFSPFPAWQLWVGNTLNFLFHA